MENLEKKDKNQLLHKSLPIILCISIIVVDQITKLLVFNNIEYGDIYASFFNGFFRITHVWNTGAAFSMGADFDPIIRTIVLKVLPLAVLSGLIVYYYKTNEFSKLQQWSFWTIIGGGFGNLIDRFFRPGGVVDFIDIDFFDIDFLGFEMTRWPVFNIADMSVVIGGALLLISLIIEAVKEIKKAKNNTQGIEHD